MSKETGNPSFAFHHAWLEVAEEKLMTAFEDLHGVCFGIIEGLDGEEDIFNQTGRVETWNVPKITSK